MRIERNALALKKSHLHLFVSCIFASLFMSPALSAQTMKFDQFSVDNGLSNNVIKSILRDSRGYLWVGTSRGLNRFDGDKFKLFEHSDTNPNSLSNNYINAILEDDSNEIWVGTISGLNLFNRKTERFIQFKNNSSDPHSISNNTINSILATHKDSIWIATENGLNLYCKSKGVFQHYFPGKASQKELNTITDLCVDRKGMLWFSTNTSTLCCLNPATGKIKYYNVPLTSAWKALSCMAIDPDGNIWLGTTADGVILFAPSVNTFTKIPVKANGTGTMGASIKDLFVADGTHLLIGVNGGGLNRLNLKTHQIQYYLNDQFDPNSLSSNGVWTTYKDSEGLLYVGTFNGGLNIYNPNKGRFKTYSHNPNNTNSVSGNLIFRFFEDSYGLVWIGTDQCGLNVFDPVTQRFKVYKNDPNNPYSISGNSIFCIKEDANHDIWVGTWANGLNRFERKTGRFYRYQSRSDDPTSIPSNNIFDLQPTANGQILVSMYDKGVVLFDPHKGVVQAFTQGNGRSKSITHNTTRLFRNINPHRLGFVTLNGFCEYDSIHHTFPRIKALSGTSLNDIYKDASGTLWVATQEKGLWVIDPKGGIKKYSKQNGFPSDVIMGIVPDKSKNIWILTETGISKYNSKSRIFFHYSSLDGLVGKQFSNNAILMSRDGTLYFGGNNGFNTINPQLIHPNTKQAHVYIDEFRIFNNLITPDSPNSPLKEVISETGRVKLSYKQSMISFGFTAVNMTFSKKSVYAYRMKGYDKGWNFTTSDRKYATYTNLEPGEYTFEVKATNNDGVWSQTPASVQIVVTPPFWKTTIAYFLYILLLIGSVFRLRYTIKRRYELKSQQESERLESEKLKELSELRLRFFTNISHEFRTPLTLLIGPLSRLIKEASAIKHPEIEAQGKLALRNAKELEYLTNQLLDFRKIETNNMQLELEHGDIIVFLKDLFDKFKLLSESKKIRYEFLQTGTNENAYFDADKIEKICNNLLSNAFKFTPENGNVIFRVTVPNNSQIEISVSDSGNGILPEHLNLIFNPFYQIPEMNTHTKAGTGIGLALCKELIELHKGTIQVTSEIGVGSCFTINFPVDKESYHCDTDVPELQISREYSTHNDYDAHIESTPVEASEQVVDANSPLVLIVEDHSELKEYIKSILSLFYRVITAADGQEGLDAAFENSPDLIITDVMMPVMNGIEMTNRIKTDIRTSHIPVIMLTALSSDDNKIKGLGMGADDYIVKPFNHELLVLKIKNLFDLRQKWRDYYKNNLVDVVAEKMDEPQAYLVVNELDEKFIACCYRLVADHLSDSEFDVNRFASEVGVSVSVLYVKMNALIGQTPAEFLRDSRMKKAGELIKQKAMTISEISFELGFKDSKHFSKTFKKYYGVSPSQYQ